MKRSVLYIGNKLAGRGRTPTSIDILGVRLEQFFDVTRVSSQRLASLRLVDMLGAIIRLRSKLDCILIDTYSSRAFQYAVAAGRLARQIRIPYIPILHGGNLPDRITRSPKPISELLNGAAAVVAPSKWLAERFQDAGYHVEVIANAINTRILPYKQREKTAGRLLWVRSFHQVYRPQMAIELLSRVQKILPEAKLVMVGPDKDGSADLCRTLAEERCVAGSVTITGGLSRTDWIKRSVDSDVFINTSSVDNQPVSVLEAMALGLPVVSTNVGGIPEMIQDGESGLLVPPDDPDAFFNAVMTLVNNPDLCRRFSISGQEVAQSFDETVVDTRWKQLIERICDTV